MALRSILFTNLLVFIMNFLTEDSFTNILQTDYKTDLEYIFDKTQNFEENLLVV